MYQPQSPPSDPKALAQFLQTELSRITEHLDWESGNFTGTLTGCTTSPTGLIHYVRMKNLVVLDIPDIFGISNTTAATITGLPTQLQPLRAQNALARIQDNSVIGVGLVSFTAGSDTLTLYKDAAGSAFVAAGSKGIRSCTIAYHLE